MCKFSEFSVTVYYSHGPRYFLEGGGGVSAIVKGKKGQYLGPWATNQKTEMSIFPMYFWANSFVKCKGSVGIVNGDRKL